MLDILRSDFLRTARAKGVRPFALIMHHAMRDGFAPIVTVVGIELGTLFSQDDHRRNDLAWPGIERLAVQSYLHRGYPVDVEVVGARYRGNGLRHRRFARRPSSPCSIPRIQVRVVRGEPAVPAAHCVQRRICSSPDHRPRRCSAPVVLVGTITLIAVFAPLVAPARSQPGNLALTTRTADIWRSRRETAHTLSGRRSSRDILSRMIWATHIALIVGLCVAAIERNAGRFAGSGRGLPRAAGPKP